MKACKLILKENYNSRNGAFNKEQLGPIGTRGEQGVEKQLTQGTTGAHGLLLAFAALVEHAKTRSWIGWVRACGGRPGDGENRLRRAGVHTLELATRGGSDCCTASSNGSSLLMDFSF
ncbi:hypothetical protein TIFTF001_017700 [Ficus carica]|uniref:Uncharacterized protein n=1 Tax=Ficus carica TaxID=3494 RepID=A0AA88AUQ4_FICCA|nr:hypothetical protein TIFTF001_017700 [Ficus carica]